ncbi:hypothetical protein [Lacipirellula limnantheis]|uniref:DUF1795 domain-containing protein n=1 Tax=Lacipirellula limnantheis TaxID=2528024 RepID=A0A517U1R9_9BACT|nr:hypothetical protein [Lacipirellula limnantheis]QDT74548.1 hypothetical protein I41_37450 [Lacipirellula limnantheis]
MRHLSFPLAFSLSLPLAMVMLVTASADEPVSLMDTVEKWRYPDAEIANSRMSDAATIGADGARTVPSVILSTTMSTSDSVEKVLKYYRELLTRNPENDKKLGVDPNVGRSVVFSDESDGREFAFHTIVINTANSSTSLIVTRAQNEERTRITWKQYLKSEIGS